MQEKLNKRYTKRTIFINGLADKSLKSLYELYELLKQYKTSNEFNREFEIKVKSLIHNYIIEQDYVCVVFYKHGVKDGYENYETLKQEL